MEPFVTITRHPYEEPHCLRLVIAASNGRLSGQLEFYADPQSLNDLADNTEVFPRLVPSAYLWELGSERPEDQIAYYLRVRFFTTDAAGHCAVQFRFNNNTDLPNREISEFCITVEPAGFTRLGKLMREFARLEHEVLRWSPFDGELYQTREAANPELR